MRKTKAKRKLISRKLLHELHKRWKISVPPPALIREFNLAISRPALVALLRLYDNLNNRDTDLNNTGTKLKNSLFPPWWNNDKDNEVQENPDDWSYEGEFPLGRWVQDENN